MAGFFGISTVSFAQLAGTTFSRAVSGLPPGVPTGTGIIFQLPVSVRVSSAAAFVGGVALGVAAIGGLVLMARRRGGRQLAAAAVSIAALALLVNLIANATQFGARVVIAPASAILGMVALVFVLIGRVPMPRLPTTGVEARSWMQDLQESTDDVVEE